MADLDRALGVGAIGRERDRDQREGGEQRQEQAKECAKSDVVIATAQVRGKKAPILLPKTTVDLMRTGSVVIDLAASTDADGFHRTDREVAAGERPRTD